MRQIIIKEYQYSNTQMEVKTNYKCYQCSRTEDLLQYDEEDGICRPCYQQQIKILAQCKANRFHKFPQIDQIQQDVFLGNQDAATTEQILKEKGITAICVCGLFLDTPFLKNPNYQYKIYQIQDFPKQQIKQHFADHFEWMTKMRDQKRKILIHCAAGVSRSASFTIAYFMKSKQIPFHQALSHVKNKRKCICPNSGFRQQLSEYNRELKLPQSEQNSFL